MEEIKRHEGIFIAVAIGIVLWIFFRARSANAASGPSMGGAIPGPSMEANAPVNSAPINSQNPPTQAAPFDTATMQLPAGVTNAQLDAARRQATGPLPTGGGRPDASTPIQKSSSWNSSPNARTLSKA